MSLSQEMAREIAREAWGSDGDAWLIGDRACVGALIPCGTVREGRLVEFRAFHAMVVRGEGATFAIAAERAGIWKEPASP